MCQGILTISVNKFVKKLDFIADTHSYMKRLEAREYTAEDVVKLVTARCENISEAIETGAILNSSRDKISRRILTELDDLCNGTLMLNGLRYYKTINLRVAWELALTSIDTKFLSTFSQGLKYIGLRVPEDGQYERLMLKYYDFLWKIRKYLQDIHNLRVLENLERFPLDINDEDEEYNKILAASIETVTNNQEPLGRNRYYVQKKTTFYINSERYFEITLQLADKYATKYNRLTVYSKKDISSNYSIQVGCAEAKILLWDNPSIIKVITNWRVSIEPASLNKLARIIKIDTKISAKYNEYGALMDFLTQTGINLLDFVDFSDTHFYNLIQQIYEKTNTSYLKNVLISLHKNFNESSTELGRNTIRFILIKLREELLDYLLPESSSDALRSSVVYLTKKCYAFECKPILYNLPKKKTNVKTVSKDVLRAIGTKNIIKHLPYIRMKHLIDSTGELYFSKDEIEFAEAQQTISNYNGLLTDWDKKTGTSIKRKSRIYLFG